MKISKLVIILVVVGMVGTSQAAYFADFNSYDEGDSLRGTDGWLRQYFEVGPSAENPIIVEVATDGVVADSNLAIITKPSGVSRDITGDIVGNTYEVSASVRTPDDPEWRQNVVLIVGNSDMSTTIDTDAWIFYIAGNEHLVYLMAVTDNNWEENVATVPWYNHDELGWYEMKLVVDESGAGSAEAFWRDASDTAPYVGTGAWTSLGVLPGTRPYDTLTHAGFEVLGVGQLDNFASGPRPIAPPPAIPGDFDADNDVDGVDFGLWQTGYPTASGASLGDGDADADGDVDGVDFGIWQENYPTNLGGAAAIPEPITLSVLAIGSLAMLARRRRK